MRLRGSKSGSLYYVPTIDPLALAGSAPGSLIVPRSAVALKTASCAGSSVPGKAVELSLCIVEIFTATDHNDVRGC
jgi:hypothetical protein